MPDILGVGDKSEHLKAWLNDPQRAIIGGREQDNKIPVIEGQENKHGSVGYTLSVAKHGAKVSPLYR
jgi:hypothetical protein